MSKVTRLGLVLLVLVMSACSKSATAPSPFTQTITGNVAVFGTSPHSLPIPQTGFLTLTMTWADPTVNLDLYLTSTTCVALYPKASCAIVVQSVGPTGIVSETVAQSVTSGQTFNIYVDNLSLSKGAAYSIAVKID